MVALVTVWVELCGCGLLEEDLGSSQVGLEEVQVGSEVLQFPVKKCFVFFQVCVVDSSQ